MRRSKLALIAACSAMIVSCGGGGTSAPPTGGSPTPPPSPSPTSTTATCSLEARQDWALAQLQEWYLFPNLLDTSVRQANHNSVQSYVDALVAPARAQSRDRYFTYLTSIEEENAFYEQGASAGFGFRLSYDTAARRVFVSEVFENAPAFGMSIDRGSELLAIGTNSNNMVSVNTLLATGGPYAVIDALGPDAPGTTRTIRLRDASGIERTVTLTKAEFALDPVSDRYGYKIIQDGDRQVGYVNLRTFIDTAQDDLREAFAAFRQAGVTELVIDLRYNGGGLIWVAELLGDLMGRNLDGQVFDHIEYRDSKSENNSTYRFDAQPQSIHPTKIAFIGTPGTASASELLINSMQPYLGENIALVGANTYGKPVGQIALDRPECDDRLRVVALRVENANHEGDYYTGLASTVPNTCRAEDDFSYQLGDPNEAMLATALDFLAGRSCTPILGGPATTQAVTPRGLLQPRERDTTDRNLPGSF